uniref:SET domain-containing protein n=1 Tax=Bionectria ochroleuca TaxID=29856 RepID=A0A8H7NQ77_BIOOC
MSYDLERNQCALYPYKTHNGVSSAIARDVLRLSDDLSNVNLSRYDGSPTPREIRSQTWLLRLRLQASLRAVGEPPSPITPASPIHTAIASLGTNPTQPHGLVPRKRLPSSAGASCDDTEFERDVLARRRKHEASLSKEDHTPSRAISSGQSSTDLRKLIYNIKNRDKLSRIPSFPIQIPVHHHAAPSRRVLTGRTAFGAFLTRLVQYHIAEAVDDTKAGRLRADGVEIQKAMNKFGWKEAERPRFFQYLRQGRLWRSICREHVGLLSLIRLKAEAPYGVSASDYLSMKGGELDRFAQMIDDPFVTDLATAAAAFQDMVLGTRHDAVFVWEKSQPQLHTWESYMTEATLLDMRDFAHAPKPPCWLEDWAWPMDPPGIPLPHKQCDLCVDASGCCYRRTKVNAARKPQIKSFGKQGIGLQALATHEGDLAYRKGEIIGQLTGRLVPRDSHPYNSLWIVEMRRFDLEGDPIVCQIDVGGSASTFRNLNHSCRSSARFIPRRASGRWIMAVEATRDVRHGEQITINFGKAFLRNQGIRCDCEVCHVST